jgi:hypothetical protein
MTWIRALPHAASAAILILDLGWFLSSYCGVSFLCFLWILVAFLHIVSFIKRSGILMSPIEKQLIFTVFLYAAGLIVTLGPLMIYTYLYFFSVKNFQGQVNSLVFSLATQNGTILSAIYFYTSTDARKQWWRLFGGLFSSRSDQDDFDTAAGETIDEIESVFLKSTPTDLEFGVELSPFVSYLPCWTYRLRCPTCKLERIIFVSIFLILCGLKSLSN